MRTHADIISDATPIVVAGACEVDANNVYQWRRNDSIPPGHWKAIADAGLSTLAELADASARKRQAAPAA